MYNQIQSLKKYVELLNSQNLDANEFLNDKQKILLQRSEYFEQLNQLAYFPGDIEIPQGAISGPTGLDEKQLAHMHNIQQAQMDQARMQQNGVMPVDQEPQYVQMGEEEDEGEEYDPGDHYEEVQAESQQFVMN